MQMRLPLMPFSNARCSSVRSSVQNHDISWIIVSILHLEVPYASSIAPLLWVLLALD